MLTDQEKRTLLKIAREALEYAVKGGKLPKLNKDSFTPALQADGASFVTLTINGQLRGCIGILEAVQPLAMDVRERAIAAGTEDPRFHPVNKNELEQIRIEISRLTSPHPLEYSTSADLLTKLRPKMDGVILQYGRRRATFLPQVWDQLPKPEDFLDHLCNKMGMPANLWREKKPDVFIYQVEEFHE